MKKLLCALLALMLSSSMVVGMTSCGDETEDDEERLEENDQKDNDDSDEPDNTATTEQNGIVHEHVWVDATCITPKTCSNCYTTEGDMLGHDYSSAVCTRCGEIDPNALNPSEGLEFELNDDGESYEVSGIGSCTDSFVVIPAEYKGLPVTSIGHHAFRNCTSLTSIAIPDSVTNIGWYNRGDVFSGCYNMTSIFVEDTNPVYHSAGNCLIHTESKTLITGCQTSVIPDDGSVAEIAVEAFTDCVNLKSIFIPDSVTKIHYVGGECGAFSGCQNLTSIKVSENNPVYHSSGNCIIETATKTLVVGCQSSIIPDDGSVTSIGEGAFQDTDNLRNLNLPNTITSVGRAAFRGCENLTIVVLPSSLTFIETSAFANCDYIYCEVPYQPFGVKKGWKSKDATVYWGDEWEYIDGVPTVTQVSSAILSEDVCWMFEYGFDDYYLYEEYYELMETLITKLDDESILPIYPINDKLFFIQRTIDTYDKYEVSIAIVNTDGEILSDWHSNWGVSDIRYNAQCGDYFFIKSDEYYSGIYYYDVVNNEGKIIANIRCCEEKYDIGEGYIFYTLGNDFGYIMNPTGDVIELKTASVMPSYGQKPDGKLSRDQAVGQISEGLFYGFSKGNVNTVAYYYNTDGEVVIDLSTRAVNFEVTKLSDFSDGQARIEFVGANGRNYYAYIDKTGSFVGEPIES